jgi:hypothetical protein
VVETPEAESAPTEAPVPSSETDVSDVPSDEPAVAPFSFLDDPAEPEPASKLDSETDAKDA